MPGPHPGAARVVLAEGADIVVAHGTEAGGHGGRRATLPLIPAVADTTASSGLSGVLVAAAGGHSRRTRPGGDDTLGTSVFDLARELDGRVLRSQFTDSSHGREAELIVAKDQEFPCYFAAAAAGDYDIAHINTGKAIGLIRTIELAAQSLNGW